jgi:hypothetical protein
MSRFRSMDDDGESFRPDSLSSAVRRLALIADDDQISVQTPARVAEALRCHGYLLCEQESAALQTWLGEGDAPDLRAARRE